MTPYSLTLKDYPNKWDTGAEYIAIYPNVLLGAQRDHCFSIVLQPNTLSSTTEHIHLYYAQPEYAPTHARPQCAPVERRVRGRHLCR